MIYPEGLDGTLGQKLIDRIRGKSGKGERQRLAFLAQSEAGLRTLQERQRLELASRIKRVALLGLAAVALAYYVRSKRKK